MKQNPIKFGTDGWRAIIAEDFTFDNVRVCAQAVANYLKGSGRDKRGLVIGYDTRFASEDFAAAAAEVVTANGIKVYLCSEPTPTPTISYQVLAQKAGGAIIITASHNAATWNGFKIKTEDGASAPTEVITEIENDLLGILANDNIKRLPLGEATKQGLIQYLDFAPYYNQQLGRLVDLDNLSNSRLKVIADSMYGAGSGYLKKLLDGGSIEVTEINGQRNPLFSGIQPEPIAANLSKLSASVKEQGASVGLATDGDADRIGIIDENGVFLTTLQVFSLISLYLLEVRGERGLIVRTITTSSMIDRLGELFSVPVRQTSVGFKYVAPIMLSENAIIGGEESGGYGYRNHMPERDGILSALYFLDLMVKTGKKPSELLEYLYSKVGPHHFDRLDVIFPEAKRRAISDRLTNNPAKSINGVKVTDFETNDGFRFILADNSWLLIRFSGTEPLLRIYAENSTPARVEQLLRQGKEMVGI